MSFLLDTNVISEITKPSPAPHVMDWLAQVNEDQVYLSVATLAELRQGIDRMPAGVRRDKLDAWISGQLPVRFRGRILAIDEETAEIWGALMAQALNLGRPMSTMDAVIAATAERHKFTLATRNISDFKISGVRLFDPWAV